MGTARPFVAVDWGTTRMRAILCSPQEADFASVPVIDGPGISRMVGSAAQNLFGAIAPWIAEHGPMRLLLGGMVGSNIGWKEVPYQRCPVRPHEIARSLTRFEARGHRVEIVPGLSCTNSLGQPDVMRGEEIQVLGWAELCGDTANSERLLCLPGTHTKWVSMAEGAITRFTTSMTGELYALLREHSVLVPRSDTRESEAFDVLAFEQGVRLAADHADELIHALFSTRSRFIAEAESMGDVASYLSGLLIGADVSAALRHYDAGESDIALIGDPILCERFGIALRHLGRECRAMDGGAAAHAGFRMIADMGDV